LKIYLELLIEAPNCSPLLIERWEFLFSPAETCSAPDVSFTFLKKSSISLRALLLTALITPAHTQYRGHLHYKISFNSTEFTPWTSKDITTFPKPTFRLQSPIGSVSAKVLFLQSIPAPQLAPIRPSEKPLEWRENKAISAALESWSGSSASSILGTSIMLSQTLAELSKGKLALNSALWTSVRYKGLELAGENEDSSDEEELIDLKYRAKESNPFAEDTETASNLANFYLKCRKIRKDLLIKGKKGDDLAANVERLQTKLREMQAFRDIRTG
jgi:hypothetical protein